MSSLRRSTLPLLIVILTTLIGCSGSSTNKPSVADATRAATSNTLAPHLAREARLSEPEGLAIGLDGTIYVLDWVTCDVVVLTSNAVTTRRGDNICGFPAKAPPTDIAVDSKNTLYLNSGCGVIVVRGASTSMLPGSEGCRVAAG